MPDYTGTEFFTRVNVSGSTTPSKVRDYDINDLLTAKGAMLFAGANASSNLASLASLPIGNNGQVLQVNNGAPSWADASAAAGVNDADLHLKVGDASASKLFSANSANEATLTFAQGTTAGYLMIGGLPIQVPGTSILSDPALGSTTTLESQLVTDGFAKKDDIKDGKLQLKVGTGTAGDLFAANQSATATLTLAKGSTNGYLLANEQALQIADFSGYATEAYAQGLTSGLATETFVNGATAAVLADANNYTDGKISALGHIMEVVGVGATYTAYTETLDQGDVYIINSGAHAGEEYVYTGTAWELLGKNDIDLTPYVEKTTTIAGIDLQDNITPQELANALTPSLGALASKDSASVTLADYATGLAESGSNTSSISALTATASSITAWNGGSMSADYGTAPTFVVENGTLKLNAGNITYSYTAPTFTNTAVSPAEITINHKSYTLSTGSKTITVS